MNVIEFFIAYWDWYLLIGVFVSFSFLLNNYKEFSASQNFFAFFLCLLIWPIAALRAFWSGD